MLQGTEGKVKVGTRTKELIKYLDKNDIAVIFHDDIDELAALSLIDTGVNAVLNTGKSMTGRYHAKGARLLLENRIPLYDVELPYNVFKDGDLVYIRNRDLLINDALYKNVCSFVNHEYINEMIKHSFNQCKGELNRFITNTIEHATMEMDAFLSYSVYPELGIQFRGRPAIVVVRNYNCYEDLKVLDAYIKRTNPVLIGVDGGADILISCGYTPDVLIGDMDSVSDIGIYRSKEIILHTYPDGICPCLGRITNLSIKYKTMSLKGTSEDIALMLAYEKGAEQIVLVGGHCCMDDFYEKGRLGMGSTILTRMMIGSKLIDFRGMGKILECLNNKEDEAICIKL